MQLCSSLNIVWPCLSLGFPCGSAGKESSCNVGDLGSIPGLGRSPGEGKGYPLQYSGLENSMDFIVHGVTKSWTWLTFTFTFFGIGMKTDVFQSCGHCWDFQICQHIKCSTFTALSFRVWSSSTGIPSPLLTLFIVMLPKAHLTSHSRMSGSRWVWSHHHGYQGHEDLFCIVLLCILATSS